MDFIKSPLNYTGGKYAILEQIFPLFPKNINVFVDIFAGGANVGINAGAKEIILNDNLTFLMDLYSYLEIKDTDSVISEVEKIVSDYKLSLSNRDGYNKLRDSYNKDKQPIKLLVLTFFSFNHQIRFNSNFEFNIPFGAKRSQYNKRIKENLIRFTNNLHEKNIQISKTNFDEYDFTTLGEDDFVYCDPPYLITTGTYNDGKRGFTGWNEVYEKKLLDILDDLNSRHIKFALSNVTHHKGVKNNLLLKWIDKGGYNLHSIDKNYANSSYHAKHRDKNETKEVLITNY